MVVDDVEDLEEGPVAQGHVGDVGLPALVGQLGREAPPRALGPLVGLGGDEAPGLEHPPDGRDRRHLSLALGQVVVNGHRPRVEAVVGQLLAQGHDRLLVATGDARGAA